MLIYVSFSVVGNEALETDELARSILSPLMVSLKVPDDFGA